MKIGYIDHFLDDWHANHFTPMFGKRSDGRCVVTYAYGMEANPHTGVTSQQWCEKYGVTLCESIDEVVEKSDVLFVAAPNEGNLHEYLSEAALSSGKPTYIDKVLADTLTDARRMCELASSHGTPCYADSPLRHASEYLQFSEKKVLGAAFWGPKHSFEYGVHQLDPLLMLMKGKVEQVLVNSNNEWQHIDLLFEDGRNASYLCTGCEDTPYHSLIRLENETRSLDIQSSFFEDFIDTIIRFYETGTPPMDMKECLQVAAVIEAVEKGLKKPGTWIPVK